jgi:hypothetical protein
MAQFATKVRAGFAACAIAVVASIASVPNAQAAPVEAAPAAPVVHVLGAGTILGPSDIPVTTWWWFGAPNPNPPPRTTIFTVNPLALIPGMIRPFFGWFAALNFEVCFAGISAKIGPYGTVSASVGRRC